MRRRLVVLLAVMATGLALGSGVALSAPASSPDAQADSAIEPRIIEGTPVPNGKYRYVAALLNKKRDGGAYQQQFCGGTLIDRNSVLTAAHCFGNNSNPRNFRVVLGRADLTSNRGVVRDVKRIFRHPRFRNANRDAAVLKLSRPVDGIPRLKLAKVSSGTRLEKPGSYATVAGWGSTVRQPGDDPSFPVRMREARIPIQRDSYAQYVYNDYFNRQIETYVPETMIAAGYTGKDTCQGDSGGPLIKQVNRNGKKVHVQIGITSWGYGCGQPRIPGVYAEVNSKQIAPFIKGAARK